MESQECSDAKTFRPTTHEGFRMKTSSIWLVIVGSAIAVSGVALRVLVDGNLIQIPVTLLVFGGVALVIYAARRGTRNDK